MQWKILAKVNYLLLIILGKFKENERFSNRRSNFNRSIVINTKPKYYNRNELHVIPKYGSVKGNQI